MGRRAAWAWQADASGGADPWQRSGDPWLSANASLGLEAVRQPAFLPQASSEVFEKFVCRIGRAFRLANADLYRLGSSDFVNEVSEVASLLSRFGSKIKPHLGPSPESAHLLDLLALLALPATDSPQVSTVSPTGLREDLHTPVAACTEGRSEPSRPPGSTALQRTSRNVSISTRLAGLPNSTDCVIPSVDGDWTSLDSEHSPVVGEIVKVRKGAPMRLDQTSAIAIEAGEIGRVVEVDGDGDCRVFWPGLYALGLAASKATMWTMRHHFFHLETSGKPPAGLAESGSRQSTDTESNDTEVSLNTG